MSKVCSTFGLGKFPCGRNGTLGIPKGHCSASFPGHWNFLKVERVGHMDEFDGAGSVRHFATPT